MKTLAKGAAMAPADAGELAERIWRGLMARADRDIRPVFISLVCEMLSEEDPEGQEDGPTAKRRAVAAGLVARLQEARLSAKRPKATKEPKPANG